MTIVDPTFSVIINTIDRAQSVNTLLRSLEYQSYPCFEAIVVVGPTQDNTLEILDQFRDRIRLLRCPTANLSQSRNIGLLAARGDLVAFIDDDAVPSYHWLAQLRQLFADPNLAGTGGKVYLVHPNSPQIQHAIGIASGLAEQIDVRNSWLENIVPDGVGYQWTGRMMGTNMAFRRRDLLEVGGFDEVFQWVYDDTDVALRLVNAGKVVHPVFEAPVYHVPASSRNRVVRTFTGNWWIQTKAAWYFNIKNGPVGGNSWREILLRCLYLWHGHLLWYRDLLHQKRITRRQMWRMSFQELRGVVEGVYYGVKPTRMTLSPVDVEHMTKTKETINPFQNATSSRQPGIDPVSGRQPEIFMPDPPLRVCLMSQAYPPDQYEGVGRHTNLIARGLFELGHTVHVITQGKSETVSFYDGAYVHRIPYQLNQYERYRLFPRLHHVLNYSHAAYERVQRLIMNDGIQVVDTPLWQMDGLVTAVSQQIPVVLRLQTAVKQIAGIQQEKDTDTRLLGDMEQTLIQQAHFWAPNSQATLKNLTQVYGVQTADKLYAIIPHGIVPAPDEAVRPFSLENPPETITVLYVGRLEKRKGILDLIEAIPLVLKQVKNVRFMIVGADNSHQDGFQHKKGMTYPAYFAARYPQLTKAVTFTGSVSEESLQAHYQECNLFVAPSLYESFGLIYLEAMNYAKPVIGCRAGGIPEVVDDGVTGLLVEPETAVSLANAIITLLQSPEKLAEMGLAGRQRLLEKFTHVEMARQFALVYRQLALQTPKSQA